MKGEPMNNFNMYKLPHQFNLNIPDIVAEFQTPLIVYSAQELMNRISILKSALPMESQLLYSVKANPNPFALRLINQAGLGFEVASAGELNHVIKTGVPPDRVVLGGPVKSNEAVLMAVRNKILSYNVESEQDLKNIKDATDQRLNVSIRINPDFSNRNSVLKMGGIASQFGIDEGEVIPFVRNHRNEVNINGLFLYAGSQFFDYQNIVQNALFLIEFAEKHRDEFNQLDFLDFGGGFGVPESIDQAELDLKLLKAGLDELFARKKQFLDGIQYKFFESGRYITATSAILISKVLDIKYSKGKKFIILDTGINHLGLRQLMYRAHGPFIFPLEDYDHCSPAILTGATCTPLDVIQNETDFPNVAIGDLVMIRNVGAYTTTLSPYNFCGFSHPAEVMIHANGNVSLIRQRGDVETAGGTGYTT